MPLSSARRSNSPAQSLPLIDEMKSALVCITLLVSISNPCQVVGQTPLQNQGGPVTVTQLGPTRSGPRWYYSGSCFSEPMRVVVRDREAWEQTWRVMYGCNVSFSINADGSSSRTPVPSPPEVDFTRDMLIMASMGTQPNSGYAILVNEAYDRGDRLEVYVRSITPRCGGWLDMMTQPMDVVTLAKTDHPIVFREIKAVTECPKGGMPVVRDLP